MASLKFQAHQALRRGFPALWQRRAYRRYLTAPYGEREIHLLAQVVDPDRCAIDVGVYEGIYARRLAELCRGVIGFEANPASAAFCRAALGKSAVIHTCALSDRAGAVMLRAHNPGALTRLFGRLGADGYRVQCVIDGRLADPPPLASLIAGSPDDRSYINNFFFLPGALRRSFSRRNRSRAPPSASTLRWPAPQAPTTASNR